jgi:hypothetical protein
MLPIPPYNREEFLQRLEKNVWQVKGKIESVGLILSRIVDRICNASCWMDMAVFNDGMEDLKTLEE